MGVGVGSGLGVLVGDGEGDAVGSGVAGGGWGRRRRRFGGSGGGRGGRRRRFGGSGGGWGRGGGESGRSGGGARWGRQDERGLRRQRGAGRRCSNRGDANLLCQRVGDGSEGQPRPGDDVPGSQSKCGQQQEHRAPVEAGGRKQVQPRPADVALRAAVLFAEPTLAHGALRYRLLAAGVTRDGLGLHHVRFF